MDTSTLKFVKEGKVKEVYAVGDDQFLFQFTDRISVFDQVIPSLIPGKGATLQRCSAHWFKAAKDMGIATHYLESPASNQMLVTRAGAFPMLGAHEPDYSWANESRTNYQIPLEVIARYYIVGSMYDRVQAGQVKPEELGYPVGHDPKKIKRGEKLPQPLVEVTTKFEQVDKPVPVDEAYRIAGMTAKEYEEMKEIVLRIDERIAQEVEPRGLIHFDGKKEFAFGPHRELVLIDTFGTGDEDRFVDKKEFEATGKIVEISKEYVRQYYREIGHHAALESVRKQNKERKKAGQQLLEEPVIPALPQEQIDETSRLYQQLMAMMIGEA